MPESLLRARVLLGGAAVAVLAIGAGTIFLLMPPSHDPREEVAPKAPASLTPALASSEAARWASIVKNPARADLPRLIREALLIRDPELRQRTLAALATRFINHDLRGFIAFLDEIDSDAGSRDAVWQALAPALLAALPQASDRTTLSSSFNEIVQRALAAEAEIDPEAALKWARQWLVDDSLQQAIATVIATLAPTRLEAALPLFNELASPLRRMEAIAALGPVLVASDSGRAISWARGLRGPSEKARGMNSVLVGLAAQDPQAAAQLLITFKNELQTEYTQRLAADRVRVGMDARSELNDPESDQKIMAEDGGAIPDPVSPDLELLDDAAAAVARQLAATDPAAAMKWTSSLENNELRKSAQAAVLESWAAHDPAAATSYYLQSAAPDSAMASSLFDAWAHLDPAVSASKAIGISDATIRREAIAGAVEGWLDAESDPAAVSGWADHLSPGAERDQIYAAVSGALAETDPAGAVSKAKAIGDPAFRQQALKDAFIALLADDASAARKLAGDRSLSRSDTRLFQQLLRVSGTP